MRKILVDFETRSEVPIEYGIPNYLSGKHAAILMMGWKIDDGPTKLWLPDRHVSLPFIIKPEDKLYAFNAGTFDSRVWNTLGPRHGFPRVDLSQWIDVMAICGRYTYPQRLAFAGEVLRLKVEKDRRGKELIKKICVPPFKFTPKEWTEFCSYCKDDVTSMSYLIKALPADQLTPQEQEIWILTQEINREGLPVDVALAKRVVEVINHFKKKLIRQLKDMTDGEITTINQVARIKSYCADRSVHLDSLNKQVLEPFLGSARADTLPKDVRALLQMRLDFGSSAIAKFNKVIEMTHRGRIHDNLIYYKANTGRWAGAQFQAHNLPRAANASATEDEAVIQKFYDTTILRENPIQAAKTLVRPVIKAPPGKVLGVADYHSIENVGLAWVAGAEHLLELHRRGLDEYIDFATQVYPIAYEDVTDDQRRFCKPPVLGAGYGLGGTGLCTYAEGMGIHMEPHEGDALISIYRQTRPEIPQLWYGLRDAAILAVQHPGRKYTYRMCAFRTVRDRNGIRWLTLRLPSGRTLVYNSPELKDDKFGLVVTHLGINSYTKKWSRKKITPGRFTENVVQAISRDIMAHGMLRLREEGYKIILSVHDEAICEIDEQQADIDDMCKVMCRLPAWAEGFPLRASGKLLGRYRKI